VVAASRKAAELGADNRHDDRDDRQHEDQLNERETREDGKRRGFIASKAKVQNQLVMSSPPPSWLSGPKEVMSYALSFDPGAR